jgi:hypothetical protein
MYRTVISTIAVIFIISGIIFSSHLFSEVYGHGTVDQSFKCPGPGSCPFNFATPSAGQFFSTGQSFTPSLTASNLRAIEVFVVDVSGGGAGSDTITVDVYNGNQPGVGPILRSSSISINTVGATLANPLLVHLEFNQLQLVSGQMYALQISSSPNTQFALSCNGQPPGIPPGPYTGGDFWFFGGINPGCDLGFVTYFSQQSGSQAIGGELLPIESASLLVAGINSIAVWMIPVLMATAGIGLVLFSRR